MSRWELRNFSDEELLEEIVRRRNKRTVAKPEHWCHDCVHFKAWDEVPRAGNCPSDFNPCTKSHEMKFITPADVSDEYGFYRRVCADREIAP